MPCMSTVTTSAVRCFTVLSIRLDWPRKLATNVDRGFSYRSDGEPICSMIPAFITATVSAIVMASSWSWVTCTKVWPTSFWIRLISICIERRSLRSRAPSVVEQQHLGAVVYRAPG